MDFHPSHDEAIEIEADHSHEGSPETEGGSHDDQDHGSHNH